MVHRLDESWPEDRLPPPFSGGLDDWDRAEIWSEWVGVIRAGREEGIDWASAKFVRAEPGIGKMGGVTGGNIDVFFSVGGDVYKIMIDDCYLTDRGWLATDGVVWKGKVAE